MAATLDVSQLVLRLLEPICIRLCLRPVVVAGARACVLQARLFLAMR